MPRTGKPDAKRRANRFGRRAEWIAAAWLTLKGYRIVARRFSVAGGEIDIVARRGDVVAFVEVKARPGLDEAATAIGEAKRRRLSSRPRLAEPQPVGGGRDAARRCGVGRAPAFSSACRRRLSSRHRLSTIWNAPIPFRRMQSTEQPKPQTSVREFIRA